MQNIKKPIMTISRQCQNSSGLSYNSEMGTPVKSDTEPVTGMTRKLLPLAAFFMAFTTVMTVLIVYMDNNAMRHYQFKVNMSQDYDLLGVSQDNPQLVMYIKEVHLTPAIELHHKPLESKDEVSPDTSYVLKLLKNKTYGVFVEAGAYDDGKTSKTEWLEEKFSWRGLLIQPDPRHYFNLRRHNRKRCQAVHACLSPTPYPKEITLHQEPEEGVRINGLLDDSDWFNTRVKCFPFYSLALAMNVTDIDYFSLETGGTELQVLETIPFERISIEVIGVHLNANDTEKGTIKKFLATKKYKFMDRFRNSYMFMMNRLDI
ncbi:unnamed protein product [Phaedon cochleariae]|uniref:Protein Star n=1 Tax=Phaedon cochleariae TaxID=80249 RepID=A0A9N9SD88_PHACE|nr:unnamed protein product [Phaedon cochleariae]